jgi:hypothetical protein
MVDEAGGYYPGSVAQPQGLPPEVQKMLGPVTTSFDPSTLNDKILVWAHDVTVEPGKTYRYKARYKLANPLYMIPNVAAQPLIDKFDLVSADSNWTDAIKVPAQTQFFVRQGIAPSGNAVVFDIYRWQNGQLWNKSLPVQIGDVVGGPDGLVDYSTGWTVVDLRSDIKSATGYVILMDATGRTIRRDHNTDANDSSYKDLRERLAAQTATANGQPLLTRP